MGSGLGQPDHPVWFTDCLPDRHHLDHRQSVSSAGQTSLGNAGLFHGQVAVVVQNNTILKKLIENIKKVDGIDKVTRVYNN